MKASLHSFDLLSFIVIYSMYLSLKIKDKTCDVNTEE